MNAIVPRKTRLKPCVCHDWRETATGQAAVLPRLRAAGTCESAVAQGRTDRRAGSEMQTLELWAADEDAQHRVFHSWNCVRVYILRKVRQGPAAAMLCEEFVVPLRLSVPQ